MVKRAKQHMDFDTYQMRTGATAAVRQTDRAGKAWATLELAGELLEAGSRLVGTATKALFRPKGKALDEYAAHIKDEAGDVLWCVARVCEMFGFRLSEVAQSNLDKVGVKHAQLTSPPPVAPVKKGTLPGAKKDITECPSCHNKELARESGCVTCKACAWSACS